MANEILVGLKIGAAVSGTLSATFASARSTVGQLGRTSDLVTARQKALRDSIQRNLGCSPHAQE